MKIKNSLVNENVINLSLSKLTLNSQSPRHTKYKPNSVLIIGKIKILISISCPPLYKKLLKRPSPLVCSSPPICISLWSVTRVLKSTLKIKPSYSLISIIILLNLSTIIIMDKSSIDILSKISSEIGFYIILVYFPVLYIYVLIVNFFKNQKK
jgi:hypothetical protein